MHEMLNLAIILTIAGVGLVAGTLGGMLGVGGSVIMIPALSMLFGQDVHPGVNQHRYQAAAMIVNVMIAAPAAWRHHRAKAVMFPAVKMILPAALAMIFLGVAVSNLPWFTHKGGPKRLGQVMAVFLVYVIAINLRRLIKPRIEKLAADQDHHQITLPRASAVGVCMGFVAGLLGIGGGAISVPLQQVILKLPLRNCIANSSAIIAVTAGFGAIYKNATLPAGSHLADSLVIAALLAPTAIIGGNLGARLTHILPVRWVRVAFIGLMIVAAWKMAF